MIIERDLPIRMDDGAVLRADVYRPDATALVPVIMTSGPYGKGVRYQEHYKLMWDWLIEQHPTFCRAQRAAISLGRRSTPKYGCRGDMRLCASIRVVPGAHPAT